MVRVADMTRNSFMAGDISTVMSPRTVMNWAENARIFDGNIAHAFRLTFLNKCDELERPVIAEFYQRAFGTDRVLDFGCGSLRLGRMLIPFLQKGGYHGIDPNAWLIEDGAKHELGQEALSIKQPKFSYNDDFNCNVFNQTFQFNIAQSLATHMGPDLLKRYLSSAYDCLEPDGIILFSYKRTEDANTPLPANGWHYPDNVSYTVDEGALPDDQYLHHLSGAVFREPQFQNSLTPLNPTP